MLPLARLNVDGGGQAEGLLERRLLVDPAGFYQFLAEAARYAAQGCTDVLFDVEGMSVGVFHLGQHVQSQYGSGRRKLNTLIRLTDRKNPRNVGSFAVLSVNSKDAFAQGRSLFHTCLNLSISFTRSGD